MADLSKKLKRKVQQLMSSLSDAEIYCSTEFIQHLQTMADSVLMHLKRKPRVYVEYDVAPNSSVAYTNGNLIHINAANPISNNYDLRESRTIALFGILFHETAHVRYMDFEAEAKIMKALKDDGKLYGKLIPKTKEEKQFVNEMSAILAQHQYRKVFTSLYDELSNIFDDVHDEAKICNDFHGIVEKGITYAAESMKSQALSLESMMECYALGHITSLSLMTSLILEYARYGKVVIENDVNNNLNNNEFLKTLSQLAPAIKAGCSTDSLSKKYTAINTCMLTLWPYIKELLMNQNSGCSSQSGSSNQSGDSGQQGANTPQPGSGQPQSGQAGSQSGSSGQQSSNAQSNNSGSQTGNDSSQSGNAAQSQSSSQNSGQSNNNNDAHANKERNNAGNKDDGQQNSANSAQSGNSGTDANGKSDAANNGSDTQEVDLSNYSPENVEKVLQSIQKAVSQAIPHQTPNPSDLENKPVSKDMSAKKSEKEPSKSSSGAASKAAKMSNTQAETIAKDIINQVAKSITQKKAEEQIEDEIKSDVNVVIKTANLTSTHKGQKVCIQRYPSVTENDIYLYNILMRDLKPISKALQKQMQNALRDVKEGDVLRHRVFGNKLESRDSYRLDGKCFTKKKLPQDVPDMAICLLLDESGSTRGERIEAERRAAIMLDDFATGLNIPIMIIGHTDHRFCWNSADGVNIYPFVDFDRVGNKDKYRLVNISSHNACNRDGMAINIASELLLKRPEVIKLLIVMSDGQPNSINYYGDLAKADIQEIIKKYKRMGIQTIATAIGDDKERIKEIYKDGYIDISDLSSFPKTLVKLVKKRIL